MSHAVNGNVTTAIVAYKEKEDQATKHARYMLSEALSTSQHQMMTGTLSITQKVLFNLGQQMGIVGPLCSMQASSFDRTTLEGRVKHMACTLLSTMDKTLELLSSRERLDPEEQQLQIATFGSDISRGIAQMMQKAITLAQVNTWEEYRAKQKRLSALNDEGTNLLYRNSQNLALAIQADEQMAMASNHGRLTTSDREAIRNYWGLIERHSGQAAGIQREYQTRFALLFLETLSDQFNKLMGTKHEFVGYVGDSKQEASFIQHLSKSMYEVLAKQRTSLIKEIQSAKTTKERILLKYLCLQGELQAPSLVNMFIRRQGNMLADQRDDLTEHMIRRFYIPQRKIFLDQAYNRLENQKFFWAEHLKEVASLNDPKFLKESKELRDFDIKISQDEIERWQKKDGRSWGLSSLGTGAEIRRVLPKDNIYERTVRQVLLKERADSFIVGELTDEVDRGPEMRLANISSVNAQHYVQKMERELSARHRAFQILNNSSPMTIEEIS